MAELNWIDRAASHGSTKWVKDFLRSWLPQLQDQAISPQDFALALAGKLEGRGLTTSERQKNYRSNVCQALKELDLNHPAIVLVSPTADQYRAMNDAQRGKLADRETKFFTSEQAEALVERATGLLNSPEWSKVAAGLAVLIGRRISEILLSGFEGRSQWSLTFREMAKKQGSEGLSIEIPTLAPAEGVLAAIQKLQRNLKIEDLKAESLSPKMAKQKVNGRFSEAVASQCHTHFADLVPARTDRETLYTHLFRAVYATIAVHWFCPPTVPEHNFKAEIQGHFTLSQEGRKLPNYSARANYDDYAIGTPEGNRDGRLGIKLGLLPGLQVMEAFRKAEPELKLGARQYQKQAQLMNINTLTVGDRNALYARASNLVLANTWSEMAIGLEVLTGIRAEVLHRAVIKPISSYVLRVDGEEVETLVQQLQSTITRFKSLPLDAEEVGLQATVDRAFGDLVKLHREDLPLVYAAILQSRRQKGQEAGESMESQAGQPIPHSPLGGDPIKLTVVETQAKETTISSPLGGDPAGFQSGEVSLSTGGDPGRLKGLEKGKFKRPALRATDLDRLVVLMRARGVSGTLTDLFGALLDAFEHSQSQQHQQQVQTLGELTSSLAWFTDRIDRLEQENQQLQQKHDPLQQERSVSQEVEGLRRENQRLERELLQYRAAVLALQNLPGRAGAESSSLPLQARGTDAIKDAPTATPAQLRAEEHLPKPPRAETLERQPKAPKAQTAEKINSIIDEFIQWNSAQADGQTRLRISIPVIRPLASLLKASNQEAIQTVLRQRQQEVQGHHDQFGITPRHNASVKGVHGILKQIAQEMELENWQQVREPG